MWNSNFIILLQGSFVSNAGSSIQMIAVSFWVLEATGSALRMSVLIAIQSLVTLILSPIAGVLIDKVPYKKSILILADIARGIVILLLSCAAYMNILSIPLLFCSIVLNGVCSSFFAPAKQVIAPSIVGKSNITSANSAMQIANSLSKIAGLSLGGILFTLFGAPLLFLLNGISFIISGISEICINTKTFIDPLPEISADRAGEKKILKDLQEGFSYILSRKFLLYTLLGILILNIFGNMGISLFRPYFMWTDYLNPQLYGIAISFLAAGNLLGAVIIYSLKALQKRGYPVFLASSVLMTLLPALIPFFRPFPVIAAFSFTGGLFQSIAVVLFSSRLPLLVEKKMLGRVFSFVNVIINGFTPLGIVAGGFLADLYPVSVLITGSFLASFALSFPIIISKASKQFFTIKEEPT